MTAMAAMTDSHQQGGLTAISNGDNT